jgi:hypothetical protein
MQDFATGDKVVWNSPAGAHSGTVVERHTSAFGFGRQQVTACADKPAFVVVCDDSGERGVHSPETLRGA